MLSSYFAVRVTLKHYKGKDRMHSQYKPGPGHLCECVHKH